ncbi:MAG: hypothetical protein WBR56_03725 [Sedimenticolaceae bacterium]
MTRIRVAVKPPTTPMEKPSLRPLTHHEILGLVRPFTERGRHLDLGASRRAERVLHFRPVDHPPATADAPTLREELILGVSERGDFRLERKLTPLDSGGSRMSATLTAVGPDAAMLLDEVERFPIARHFPTYDGVVLQRSYHLEPRDKDDDPAGPIWDARLIEATAEVAGVRLDCDAKIRSLPIKVNLTAPSGQCLAVPRDLLAVLGWPWRPIDDYDNHWRSSIRVPKREPRRTADIEDKLGCTVRHLAETLSQPPARFHARHLRERWRASFQRGIPLFAALGLIGGALSLTQVPIEDEALLKLLAFNLPPLMLAAFFFGFDDLPSIEIPRVPRALKQDSWLVRVDS